MGKPSVKPRRYFALHDAGIRNGSFFRVYEHVNMVAQFVNGDHMGTTECSKSGKVGPPYTGMFGSGDPVIVDGIPKTYAGKPLQEYLQDEAERLIPDCCI